MFATSTIMASATAWSYCFTDAPDLATASFNLKFCIFVSFVWTTFIARISGIITTLVPVLSAVISSDALPSSTAYAVISVCAAIVFVLTAGAA